MEPTKKGTEAQFREKQDTPALPVLFTFVKWTVQSELIHSAHLLTRNSAMILSLALFTWTIKNLIFLEMCFIKKISV
jgi:hypothetical protein